MKIEARPKRTQTTIGSLQPSDAFWLDGSLWVRSRDWFPSSGVSCLELGTGRLVQFRIGTACEPAAVKVVDAEPGEE